MGEAKRRKSKDKNYGKPKPKIKDKVYYISTSNKELVLNTAKIWQKSIENSPQILSESHKKFLSSRYAKDHGIDGTTISLDDFVQMVAHVYKEFARHTVAKGLSSLYLRFLKDRDNNIYSIAAIEKSKFMINSSNLLLNQPMPWIEMLLVNPLLLNQGIGKLTFQYIIAELDSQIAGHIYMDSSGFFEKQGFRLQIYYMNNDADIYLAQDLSSDFNLNRKELLIPRKVDEYTVYDVVEIVHSSNVSPEEITKLIEIEYPQLSSSILRTLDEDKKTSDNEYVVDESISKMTSIPINSSQNTKEKVELSSAKPNLVPDYEELTNIYLSSGLAPLQLAIMKWLEKNVDFANNFTEKFNHWDQISMTVFDIASKRSQVLASHDLKTATFSLKVPFDISDYGSYKPVQSQLELAKEGMRLINTGFFDKAICELINIEMDSIKTLRQNGIVLYMGMNDILEIYDAACALVKWKPFSVVHYVGEQRNNLDSLIARTFAPLSERIQDFRIKQKRSDKFPCLTLLCLVESKVTGSISEFRRHFTAQSGGQLIIPGFSDGSDGVIAIPTPMDIMGYPKKIPSIR